MPRIRLMSKFVTLSALCLSLAAPSASWADDKPAQAKPDDGRWERLGERVVDGRADHDTIAVGKDEGAFTAIQIKVEGSSLAMFDVKVTFGNGEVFSPNTRLIFEKGTTSRVIDLPGEKRGIKRVDFKYGNLPGGGRARVELMARAAPGWERLGERTVDGRVDRDVIQVGAAEGAFRAIQLKVEGSALALFDVKVVFGNGEAFEPKTRLVFDKDSSSRVIDLPGEKRNIRRVEFRYGNLPGGGRARIELMAR